VKRFYARTNKRKTFGQQIAKQQRRERVLKKIREQWKEQELEQQLHTTQSNTASIHCPAPNVTFEESDPLPKTLPEVHHHISSTTRLKENIHCWVDFHKQNNDEAIKVIVSCPLRTQSLILYRILFPVSRIIYFHGYLIVLTMVTKLSIQRKTGTPSNSSAIGYISTKHSVSTTQRTTYVDNKILSIHEHTRTLYCCHMKKQVTNSMPILIGMQELLEFSTLMLSISGQSQLHQTSVGSIFSGFDGLAVMFRSKLVGQQSACIALVSLMLVNLTHLDFWILLRSSVVPTLYQPLPMAEQLSFLVHPNLLHDYHYRKILIGAITMSTCE
jgi:hypothetical protein